MCIYILGIILTGWGFEFDLGVASATVVRTRSIFAATSACGGGRCVGPNQRKLRFLLVAGRHAWHEGTL